MSRSYEMEIRVEGIKKDKIDAVLDFLKDAWFDEVADDTRIEIENGICDNPDGNIKNGAWYPPDGTIDFSMRQVGYLSGGEGDNEWSERMYKGIREINDAKCKVEVEAVYLDDMPFETYSFGDDEVENDSELVDDYVNKPDTVKILEEYFDKTCEDIDFDEIKTRTGIEIYPKTKGNLCDMILKLKGDI